MGKRITVTAPHYMRAEADGRHTGHVKRHTPGNKRSTYGFSRSHTDMWAADATLARRGWGVEGYVPDAVVPSRRSAPTFKRGDVRVIRAARVDACPDCHMALTRGVCLDCA